MGVLAVTGERTTIVQRLKEMLPEGEEIRAFPKVRHDSDPLPDSPELIVDPTRYVFAGGLLHNKPINQLTSEERQDSIFANAAWPVRLCELILANNPKARICVVGSESGFKGSHDTTYAFAKAALHGYVQTKRIKGEQQLVCVAPWVIWDSGMTQRRQDREEILSRFTKEHPKGRLLTAEEVARLIYFLLYEDRGYITNTVIRMDGGAHATA